MKCKNCNTEFSEGVFCPNCGTKNENTDSSLLNLSKNKTCKNCGANFSEGEFCPNCGTDNRVVTSQENTNNNTDLNVPQAKDTAWDKFGRVSDKIRKVRLIAGLSIGIGLACFLFIAWIASKNINKDPSDTNNSAVSSPTSTITSQNETFNNNSSMPANTVEPNKGNVSNNVKPNKEDDTNKATDAEEISGYANPDNWITVPYPRGDLMILPLLAVEDTVYLIRDFKGNIILQDMFYDEDVNDFNVSSIQFSYEYDVDGNKLICYEIGDEDEKSNPTIFDFTDPKNVKVTSNLYNLENASYDATAKDRMTYDLGFVAEYYRRAGQNPDFSYTHKLGDFDTDGFIFWDSDNRYLTDNELSMLNLEQLGFARNEIFARYGNNFKTDKYRDHYSQYEWYNNLPKIDNIDVDSVMNPIEIANINLIQKYEELLKK